MTLESNKTLGGIGAILLAIPFLNLFGIILVLIAMKGMGDYYNDDNIFKNALYGFIFGIVGVVALVAVIIMFALGFAAISTITPLAPVFSGFWLFITAFVILYVFSLIAAVFYKRALDILAKKSSEPMFSTAGLILLIGAFIPVIGEILRLIGWILAAVGFFNAQPTAQVQAKTEQVPISEDKRFCVQCGEPLQPGAIYCQKCGKRAD